MRIALLSQAGESGRHLRDALAGSGTPIVYEAQATELDRDALEKSGARVVVVNLDADVEAHLDEVYSLLDDDRYNVIFNEAQVSSQLSGWEQARWARHLAAKILGTENADPPRPAGAEPVPQRVHEVAQEIKAAEVPESVDARSATNEAAAATKDVEQEGAGQGADSTAVEDDYSDIARLLSEVDPDPDEFSGASIEPSAEAAPDLHKTVPMPELDLSEFDLDFEPAPEPVEMSSVEREEDEAATRQADSADTVKMPALDVDAESEGDVLGFGDLDDFAGGVDDIDTGVEEAQPSNSLEDDLAESSSLSEAAAVGEDISGIEMLDLDWADAPEVPEQQDARDEIEDVPPPEIGSAFAWSLEDMDGEAEAEESKAEKAPAEPRDFGIEKISASEYLAPESENGEAEDSADSDISLELIPLDEAVAPAMAGKKSATESEGRESWLDTSNRVAVSRVWVLGASIGGPEAVREFLAELPAKSPALFLLAQHMGAEFMEIMAQQLSRSTTLTVRTPSHGERVGHGDIVVVPTTHRLRVDREGVVTLEALGDTNLPNTPSIDQVLQDVADRFGSKAGFIVFSGMAEDAAEGSRYLAGIGGKVYAQDPETCVISSMVDGVIETGVVSFTGSPKALAGKLLGEFKS
ncbi:chemotaxis protein CheB [Dokdonella sp.]|uniref:chemotaxis protein CheB n=1 Tax=Dokdonella sp. TaxID=2291710 RepID=UPI0035291A45